VSDETKNTVTITVNGREVEADPAKPLIAACHAEDVDVPHYCYHPGLTPVGSCRICQVEVKQGEMPPRVMVACRTPVAPGMVVNTEAPKAHDARRECLEFLLKNHPLDCPICDKAGECTLQDYSFDEGQGAGRSSEPRRKLEKRKDLGDVIVLDQERCILCSRCVRFMEEVPKSPQLTIGLRGSHSCVETFADRPLSGNYQGNLADVCPVGALTLKPFRFQARVWNLNKTASRCAECSRGCATTVEVLRDGEVKRFRPREDEAVNGHWMCDTGRFAFDAVNAGGRLAGSMVRGDRSSGGSWQACDTHYALEIARDMLVAQETHAIVASPFLTNEEAALLISIAKHLDARICFVSPDENGLADDLLHTGDPCPNRAGLIGAGFDGLSADLAVEGLHEADVALLIGERVGQLLGVEALEALPTGKRLITIECHVIDVPAADVAIGAPNCVERTGTWTNVEGHEGRIRIARSAPPGTWQLDRTLETLAELLASRPVAASQEA